MTVVRYEPFRLLNRFQRDFSRFFDESNVANGEVASTGNNNEAEIKSETVLPDFGLLITMEDTVGASPIGPGVAHIHIIP